MGMIPLGDDNIQGGPPPIVNWALIALNLLAFFLELSQGSEARLQSFITAWGVVPREYSTTPAGHPGAPANASLWVNRTVSQRDCEMAEAQWMRGERAPKCLDPMGIGRMITTKVNANIGASPVASSMDEEIDKLRFAQRYGADTLMDLSTGGALAETRQALLDNSTIPIGTVPIYAMIFGQQNARPPANLFRHRRRERLCRLLIEVLASRALARHARMLAHRLEILWACEECSCSSHGHS